MWRFQQTGQQESTRTNILDEAGSILADSKGTEYSSMLQKRWRSMTGLELTAAHPTMQPRASFEVLEEMGERETAPGHGPRRTTPAKWCLCVPGSRAKSSGVGVGASGLCTARVAATACY